MIGRTIVKVCGLTSAADARVAAEIGADYLGFIFHPESSRAVTFGKYLALAAELPPVQRVAVMVEPDAGALAWALDAGFARIQIHFNAAGPLLLPQAWSEQVGRERLWLVPRLPPGTDVPPQLLALADTFLLDTFHAQKFGGTGQTGDWAAFRRQQAANPDRIWILSGGLTPDNVAAALAATRAGFIDVNSGVELAPGQKDADRNSGRTAF